jgi:hypothetical protein
MDGRDSVRNGGCGAHVSRDGLGNRYREDVMVVHELVAKLSNYPPEMPVYFPPVTDDDGKVVQYEVVGTEVDDGVVVLLD